MKLSDVFRRRRLDAALDDLAAAVGLVDDDDDDEGEDDEDDEESDDELVSLFDPVPTWASPWGDRGWLPALVDDFRRAEDREELDPPTELRRRSTSRASKPKPKPKPAARPEKRAPRRR